MLWEARVIIVVAASNGTKAIVGVIEKEKKYVVCFSFGILNKYKVKISAEIRSSEDEVRVGDQDFARTTRGKFGSHTLHGRL